MGRRTIDGRGRGLREGNEMKDREGRGFDDLRALEAAPDASRAERLRAGLRMVDAIVKGAPKGGPAFLTEAPLVARAVLAYGVACETAAETNEAPPWCGMLALEASKLVMGAGVGEVETVLASLAGVVGMLESYLRDGLAAAKEHGQLAAVLGHPVVEHHSLAGATLRRILGAWGGSQCDPLADDVPGYL